jgi:hypothetical protein
MEHSVDMTYKYNHVAMFVNVNIRNIFFIQSCINDCDVSAYKIPHTELTLFISYRQQKANRWISRDHHAVALHSYKNCFNTNI